MPIYEYKCGTCGKTTTELRPMSESAEPLETLCLIQDDPKPVCKLKRILSPTPTTFRFNDRIGWKGLDKKTRGT